VAMEFHAPGADIVGFEYAAESEGDRAAVDRAVALLAAPLDLFEFPAAAECSVIQARAGLESEELHEDYALERDRDDHGENEDHSEDSGHESHDENGQAAQHAEFHAEYTLGCANSEALTNIFFGYFDTFSNAHELDVQIITKSGAQAFEVARDAPVLELQSLF